MVQSIIEKVQNNRYLPWICVLSSLVGGAFAWWVDSRNDEPQAAVLVIIVVTSLLGMVQPGKAWLWALIVGACLPGGYLVAQSLAMVSTNPIQPGWYAAALAFIPAFIGAYMGALGRAVFNTAVIK